MLVQILTNAESMLIEDHKFEPGELQFIHLCDTDEVFPCLNLGLESLSDEMLKDVVKALSEDGDSHTLAQIQRYGYLDLQHKTVLEEV
ncbi:hypothetical protein [Escherichia coli]|uniref:hypothetical protein n=1 Tax=Escherichia coli TaxID=562 RepID=UPI000CFCF972|nr:hypothetical protein [Escherichia coli]